MRSGFAPTNCPASPRRPRLAVRRGSLTRRLTALADGAFRVEPLLEGWQTLRDDECQGLDVPTGSSGWVREVYLHGHDRPWVFARSVAARSALEGSGFDLALLGSRSLGELLFSDSAFERGPIEVCRYPAAGLPAEVRAEGLWGRRSRFSAARSGCWWRRCTYRACGTRRESPTYNPRSTPEVPMFVTLIKPLARLHPRAWDFVQLVRLDQPIGIYLLLWPTLWSLWIAADGVPELKNLLIFVLGVILMRAAGCVINDFADRNFDGHVARTKARPLATGKISVREAWITFAVLVALSFGLVLLTNATTVWLSFGAVAVASLYPFMKRYTYYPQVVLGAAYSWGILMAFTAERGELPASAWLLFLANVLWTVAYDSYYAMTDREDDLKIGIKSTAILFGDADRLIIGSLQGLTLLLLVLAGNRFELGLCFYLGLAVAAACFVWEAWSTRDRDPQACFRAFLHNHWAGLAIFLGTVADYALR